MNEQEKSNNEKVNSSKNVAREDAAVKVIPDVIKVISTVATFVATDETCRNAFASIVRERSNGKVVILTKDELDRMIRERKPA